VAVVPGLAAAVATAATLPVTSAVAVR